MIPLRHALRLVAPPAPQVAFVGAGGKTSALFALARQFQQPVLVTTSTHLAVSQLKLADEHIVLASPADVLQLSTFNLKPTTVITGSEVHNERASGPSEATLAALSQYARQRGLPLLVEADGARERPLKALAEHEPAIPAFVDQVVVVAGLSALDQPLGDEVVHRPERFAALSGLQPGAVITPESVAAILLSEQGGLKSIPPAARRVALLNQADTPELQGAARGLAARLLAGYDAVLVAALQHGPEVQAVYERTAGILLAAGGSQRLGRPKQLLDWKGQPFVRQAAQTAIAAGLSPLVVVTGAAAAEVEAALAGLPVQVVHNADWATGQSGSVKAGLAALPANVGAALFMVVDQPQLPVALIDSLRAEHAGSLAPIVAPLVDGQRSNPVLFDRSTFPDFAAVQGDVGGRAIFSRHKVTWVPWLDVSLSIDVDTPEDYDRLLRQAG